MKLQRRDKTNSIACTFPLNLSLSELRLESYNVIVTFESVDEILKCSHSNKSY